MSSNIIRVQFALGVWTGEMENFYKIWRGKLQKKSLLQTQNGKESALLDTHYDVCRAD